MMMGLTEEEERLVRTHRIERELRKLKDIPGLLKNDLSGLRICSQVSGHVFRRFEPMETAGEDGDEGDLNESDEACVRPVEDRIQPAIAAEPSEGEHVKAWGGRGWFPVPTVDRLLLQQWHTVGRACVSRSSSGSSPTMTA